MEWMVAAAPAEGPSALISLAPMFIIFGIFYVIWFLPLRRKQKALEAMLEALAKGDRVVTNGGLYGEVVKVDGAVVVLKLADNVKVRVAKRAVAGLEETGAEKGKASS